jgi:Tfp pilus assembly major pilin PilA
MGAGGVMGMYVYAAMWIPYAAGPDVEKQLTEAEAQAEAAKRTTPKAAAVAAAALASGLPLTLSGSKVSGPASIPGPSKTTTKSDGSTSTQSTKFDCTYVDDAYTCTQTDTTVDKTTDNGTDTTKTTTTTTDPASKDDLCTRNPGIAACETVTAPTDTPLPPIPKLYDPKYPDGLTGVWNQKKDQLQGTAVMGILAKLMPSVQDGGTCPQMLLNLDVGIRDFGIHDVAPPCWLWTFGKAVIIASALLLARALIFGG